MDTVASSEDPDEMPHKGACLEIISQDLWKCTMDHPDFIVCSCMENSIGLKRVKQEWQ